MARREAAGAQVPDQRAAGHRPPITFTMVPPGQPERAAAQPKPRRESSPQAVERRDPPETPKQRHPAPRPRLGRAWLAAPALAQPPKPARAGAGGKRGKLPGRGLKVPIGKRDYLTLNSVNVTVIITISSSERRRNNVKNHNPFQSNKPNNMPALAAKNEGNSQSRNKIIECLRKDKLWHSL